MPEHQSIACATQAWLLSTWHVQVPFAWLEACIEWLQGEAGGAGRLSQQQVNQQVLDQWFLTDLRDLDHPVLPEGLAQAQKTELSGTFCVQVDSLLDVSQPAYGQLQKWRGTDCSNDEVSAVTQTTQRPWEAKSTRMLLLQVTDGVQTLEAMEYQSIPALTATLRPGVKLQLQGQMVCRLGVLLLGPSNVKILGGEVEDLVERNSQGKVLCRALGRPEEEQQPEGEGGAETPTPQQRNHEIIDLEMEDDELLASLEEQGEIGPPQESGYETLQETSTPSSRNSFVSSLVSSRSERSPPPRRNTLTRHSRVGSVQVQPTGGQQQDSNLIESVSSDVIHRNNQEDNVASDEYPDEDFDDLPLDELDGVILQESENVTDASHRSTFQNNNKVPGNPGSVKGTINPQISQFKPHALSGSGTLRGSGNYRSTTQKRDHQGGAIKASRLVNTATSKPFLSSAASESSSDLQLDTNDGNDFMDEDMDCVFQEIEDSAVKSERTEERTAQLQSTKPVTATPRGKAGDIITAKPDGLSSQSQSNIPAVTLTSAPFTYLVLLEELMSKPQPHPIEVQVKAFIVTLLGKLSSSNGVWSVCATISDGTGYLDVELSNEVLTHLLGFSVAEKAALKCDPARRGVLDSGMRRCQENLVDMCCIMMIVVEPDKRRGVVAKAEPVSERVLQELEQRVRERRK